MVTDKIRRHTSIYMDRTFLTADEINEHRKEIIDAFEELSQQDRREVIVYWLEAMRDKHATVIKNNMEYELELYNNRRMIDLKTFIAKTVTVVVGVVGFIAILVAVKDLWPLVEKNIIQLFGK